MTDKASICFLCYFFLNKDVGSDLINAVRQMFSLFFVCLHLSNYKEVDDM